jgi:SAM-dependent methyltransferase
MVIHWPAATRRALTCGRRLHALPRITSHHARGREGVITTAYANLPAYHPKLGCPGSRRWSIIQAASVFVWREWPQFGFEMVLVVRKAHWEKVYASKAETGVSWHQDEPRLSLGLIRAVALAAGGRIIDVGGGTSVLVDRLLDLPFERIAVLDIAETALGKAKSRLGERAGRVEWIASDVTRIQDVGTFDVWHDRAVFHFLTDEADRRKYVDQARQTLPEGGHLIIASFADDGPKRCSDLDVCRYNAASMAAEMGEGFSLIREARETHVTPRGTPQAFFYGVFRRL